MGNRTRNVKARFVRVFRTVNAFRRAPIVRVAQDRPPRAPERRREVDQLLTPRAHSPSATDPRCAHATAS